MKAASHAWPLTLFNSLSPLMTVSALYEEEAVSNGEQLTPHTPFLYQRFLVAIQMDSTMLYLAYDIVLMSLRVMQ